MQVYRSHGSRPWQEIVQIQGTKIFDEGILKSSLSLGCKSHVLGVCASVVEDLVDIQRLFREQGVYHICSVQISSK